MFQFSPFKFISLIYTKIVKIVLYLLFSMFYHLTCPPEYARKNFSSKNIMLQLRMIRPPLTFLTKEYAQCFMLPENLLSCSHHVEVYQLISFILQQDVIRIQKKKKVCTPYFCIFLMLHDVKWCELVYWREQVHLPYCQGFQVSMKSSNDHLILYIIIATLRHSPIWNSEISGFF